MRKFLTLFIAVIISSVAFGQAPKRIISKSEALNFDLKEYKALPESRFVEALENLQNVAVPSTHSNSVPIGTVTSSAVTAVKIGQASNSYSSIVHNSNQLPVFNNAGTNGGSVAFIFRQNIQECGGVTGDNGRYRYSISTTGGQTWDIGASTVPPPFTGCHGKGPILPSYTRPARYPNMTMFSLSNAPSVDSLAVAFSGPVLQASGSGWDGTVVGTVLGAAGTFANTNVTQELYQHQGGDQYFTYSLVHQIHPVSGDLNFWFISHSGNATQGNGRFINKGTYNPATKIIDWQTPQAITLNYFTNNIDGNSVASSGNIAFDPSGKYGWVGFLGDLVGGQDSTMSPILMSTTDGGDTWSNPTEFDLTTMFPDFQDSLLNALVFLDTISTSPLVVDTVSFSTGKYICAFDMGLQVDSLGNPHVLMNIGHPSAITNPQANYSINGIGYDIYCLTKDTYGDWNMLWIADQNSFRGTFGSALMDPAGEFTVDPYVQVARNVTGSKMFYSWTDTDTAATGGTDNNAPDLLARAYDVKLNKITPEVNWTSNDLNWATQVLFPKTSRVALGDGCDFTVPTVIQSLDNGDGIQPVSYWYFQDVTYNCSDFTEDPVFFYNCKENPFANTVNITDASCGTNNDGVATAMPAGGIAPYTYLWDDGSTNASRSALAAGVYSVTIIDSKGCSEDINVIVANTGSPTATVDPMSVQDPLCANGNTGTATVTTTGGSGGNTITWSNGETTATATMLPPGQSTVTVTDMTGCSNFAVINLTSPPAITVNVEATDVDCNGNANGEVEVTLAAGGVGNFTFSWNTTPPSTGAKVTGLSGGSYTVTATDGNGCMQDVTVNVAEPAVLGASTSFTLPSSPSANDGTATATATGGTLPYTYTWTDAGGNPAGTGSFVFGLGNGVYTVTVTDDNGCTSTATVNLNTGIEDDLAAGINKWELFPNPTTGVVTFQVAMNEVDQLNMSVINMKGQVVGQRDFGRSMTFNETLNLSDLSAGIYMVQLATPNGTTTRKLVIK